MATIKKKIAPAMMGPKRILATPEKIRSLDLGYVVGVATGIAKHAQPDGEILEGLAGRFKFQPFNMEGRPEGDYVLSYILWLPSGMGTDVFDAVRTKNDADGNTLAPMAQEFAYIMETHKADNPAGYEWGMRPLLESAASDPLAILEAKLADINPALVYSGSAAALPAPDGTPTADGAPPIPAPAPTPAPAPAPTPAPTGGQQGTPPRK